MAGLEVWGAQGQNPFGLESSPFVVGRSGDCDLVLDDDDSVSRHHAVLERFGEVWQVHDLGSRNGTWGNGARITSPPALRPGDTIIVGRTRLVFRDRAAVGAAAGPSTSPLAPPPRLTPAQSRTLV